MTNLILDSALNWWDQGVTVIPLRMRGKNPLVPWKQFVGKKIPKGLIEVWFRRPSNLGVLMGQGLVVCDFDSVPAYYKWRSAHREQAKSYTVQTARGFHVYFRSRLTPEMGGRLAGEEGQVVGDLKVHGYVVGAHSIHQSGATYREMMGEGVRQIESLEEVGVRLMPPPPTTPHLWRRSGGEGGVPGLGIINKIKGNIPIEMFFSERMGVRLIRSGPDSMVCICPFHPDSNPSMRIWPAQRRAFCYSPNCVGHLHAFDVIDAYAYTYGVSTNLAISILSMEVD